MDKAERLPRNVQRDHARGRTGIIQMPRQFRRSFSCLQSTGRRRLQQEFSHQRCGSRRLAFRHLTCSRQAISRALLERRLSRCFGGKRSAVHSGFPPETLLRSESLLGSSWPALYRADRDALCVGGQERRRVVEAQEEAEEAHGFERQSEEGYILTRERSGPSVEVAERTRSVDGGNFTIAYHAQIAMKFRPFVGLRIRNVWVGYPQEFAKRSPAFAQVDNEQVITVGGCHDFFLKFDESTDRIVLIVESPLEALV